MYKYFLLSAVSFFSVVTYTQAFSATLEEVPVQYDVVKIDTPEVKQIILGELNDSPEMYEISSDQPFKLTVSLRALPKSLSPLPANFTGLIIKQKAVRGVEEVARLKAVEANWEELRDSSTGLSYQNGPNFSQDMASGTYRVEVSTPDNHGKYLLVIGDQTDDNGYFTNLGNVATVYEFYGLSKIRMFSSPFVHYPLGILILLSLIFVTWRKNRSQTTNSTHTPTTHG